MRTGRIETSDGEVVEVTIDGDVARNGERTWELSDARLLPPVDPGKLIYVGMNYADHARELNAEIPKQPLFFFKPRSALIGDGDSVVSPPESSQLEYEGELAAVIGKRVRNLGPREAMDAVAGYTIANDITARDLQRLDSQWTRAKGWDTFAPLGPWVETDIDPADVEIQTIVNGEVRQHSSTRNLIFGVAELVSEASRLMTLEPGDVIATGTPPGVGRLEVGDVVEVKVAGIGALRNVVKAEGGEAA
jgi:2-keto-4-pentenoate hydratase/2-oxohepta-3-ene-1,7-dioic acid hydratase in catechol pathway